MKMKQVSGWWKEWKGASIYSLEVDSEKEWVLWLFMTCQSIGSIYQSVGCLQINRLVYSKGNKRYLVVTSH